MATGNAETPQWIIVVVSSVMAVLVILICFIGLLVMFTWFNRTRYMTTFTIIFLLCKIKFFSKGQFDVDNTNNNTPASHSGSLQSGRTSFIKVLIILNYIHTMYSRKQT